MSAAHRRVPYRLTMIRTPARSRPDPSPPARQADRPHLEALDGVRGLAIAAVVAFHLTVMATRGAEWAGVSSPPLALWPLFASKLGVDVFFVLSGFLVLQSWTSIRRRLPGREAVADFASRRARRVLPAYLASLVILVPLRVPEWLGSLEGVANIITFMSLQQFLAPELPHEVNVVTWSLTTEVHFYVLLPVLAVVLTRFGWARLLAGVLLVSVTWRLAVGGTGEEAEWIIGRLDQFVAGMAAAAVVAEHRDGGARRIVDVISSWPVGVLILAGAIFSAVPLGGLQLMPKPLLYASVFHAVAGLTVAAWIVRASVRGMPAFLRNRALVMLGTTSYSLYLWHWVVMSEATRRFGTGAPVLAGALVVTAALTAASYLAFERPFLRTRRSPEDRIAARASM